MPLVKRKQTLFGAISTIVLTPFIFILVAIRLKWWILLPCVCLFFFFMWTERHSLKDLIPGKEQQMIWGGLFCFLMFVATLLTIKDFIVTGGYETIWEPDEYCVNATRIYAEQIINSDFTTLYESFSISFKERISLDEFIEGFDQYSEITGQISGIKEIKEIEIYDYQFKETLTDAVTLATFYHTQPAGDAFVEFYLNCKDNYQIVGFNFHFEE